jgi:hypothetical protein
LEMPPMNWRTALAGADTLQYFDRDKANRFPRVLKLAVNSLPSIHY